MTEVKKTSPCIAGSIGAAAVGSVAPTVSMPLGIACINKMVKVNNGLQPDQFEKVNNAAQDVLKNLQLDKKGVKIVNIPNIVNKSIYPDFIREMIDGVYATSKGRNAFFTDKAIFGVIDANCVGVNKSKLPLATFHELGHAHNYNYSKLFKSLQKMRTPGMLIATTLPLFCAFTRDSKPAEGKELTAGQKFKNGLRKFSPVLAGVAMVPTLVEELAATFKGNKAAKEVFKDAPELFKKVVKGNRAGYISYAASIAGVMFATWAAKKIKDVAVEKKEAKLQAKTANVTEV